MASSEQLKLVIDVVNKNALKGMGDLKKAAKGVGDELDDTRTAAKRVAAEMERRADEMASDLKSSEKAAEALANALGPEMASKIGDARLDNFIGDLKRAGLSFEEVEADAESFAQALRKMDAAADSVKNVDKAMARVGETTDNTRSVVANFAGNAAQELPGVSQALGPLNMAIGQFAEYASEGNIQLEKFITAGVGLAGAAGVMALIAKESEHIAKINAFKSETVDNYADALKETKNRVDAVRIALEKAEKVEFIFGDDDPTWGAHGISVLGDMTKLLNQLGLNADGASRLIAGGQEDIARWGEALKGSGADAALVDVAMDGLTQQVELFNQAADNTAASTAFFSEKVNGAVEATNLLSDANKENAQRMWEAGEATRDAEQATKDYDRAYRELLGQIDQEEAWANLAQRMWEFSDGVGDTGQEARDLKRDMIDMIAEMDNIPKEKKTKLLTMIDRGALSEVYAELAKLQNSSIVIPVKPVGSGLSTLGAGGKRASGGQVREGVAYEWNEQGKEMFVPNTNGVVVPHGALNASGGGGMVVNVYPRTMPTERELIDLINGIRRKQGGVI